MDKITCISCGGYIKVGYGAVKFPCPECSQIIGRCKRCRELGKRYVSQCGLEGP